MSVKSLLLLLSLLIFGLLLILVVPIGRAEEINQIPTFQPTLPPPTPGESETLGPSYPTTNDVVVSLPYGDPFDAPDNWIANNAWAFEPLSGFDGSGWWLDGFQRDRLSTLEFGNLIDLSGALSAQLVLRNRGWLPSSDLVAVDLSLDGGITWIPVDQRIGINLPDWNLHIIDLTPFRGQIIQFRFRVNTGSLPAIAEPSNIEAEVSPSPEFWIDNLSIQFVMTPPSEQFVYAPLETGPRTLMGLHLVVGARTEPIVDLAKQLRQIGWPLGTVKGTSSTENILNAVAAVSPETIIVYRSLLTPQGQRDCPAPSDDPRATAREWVAGVQSYWDSVNADYYELVNECEPPLDWQVAFSIEAMRLAKEQNRCLLLFSFGVGNPEPWEFAQLLPVFEYALENPCLPGRYHGIALHAYGLDPYTLLSESGIYLGYRHRLLYSGILETLPEAVRIPVYLTEAGTGDGMVKLSCDIVARDIIQYTRGLEYDPYIKGFHFWNLGPGESKWVDYTECLPAIGNALVNYYAGKTPP